MNRIVGDLLDLTRTRLGSEIPIVRAPIDVGPICQMVIAELEVRAVSGCAPGRCTRGRAPY